ncbi:MAG: peptidoglycan DD-metalloendopeptidase family protein [bacterium]|nr:peptidoglycan DD-metalloendopeptidase family protein [bacterium]
MKHYDQKNKNLTIIILLFVVHYLLLSVALAATPEELRAAIDGKAKDLQELNRQIQETQQKIESTQGQQKTLNKELEKLGYNINQVNLGIKSSEINIQKTALEIESLKYDIADKEKAINQSRSAIAELIRNVYQNDHESLLLVILKHNSLAASFAEWENINSVSTNLASTVYQLEDLQNQLSQNLIDESNKKDSLESEQKNLKNRQLILTDQKQERQTLLSQTKNKEKTYQQQLQELEERQAAISDEIENIEDELRRTFDPTLLPVKRHGLLALPLKNQRITQNFGEISYLYRGKPHNGMDFGAAIGTPIFASADGIVKAVGNNGRYQYGKHILIDHDNNLSTLYAHLSKQIVTVGQKVIRGQLIGYSGNTGYATGPHLHLGLYWTPSVMLKNLPQCNCGLVPLGVTIDPADYL